MLWSRINDTIADEISAGSIVGSSVKEDREMIPIRGLRAY